MTNHAELLIDGHRILPSLLEDIEQAESSIHLSMFLFFRDPIGKEIAEALSRKARAGVEVCVLLNIEKTAMGDPFSTGERRMMRHDPDVDYDPLDVKPLCDEMRAAGVKVCDTNIDYDRDFPMADARLHSMAVQIRKGISIDDMHVDHRKLVLIDGRIGYCGGANIGAQYMYHLPFDPQRDSREEGDERKAAKLPEPWWKWHDSLTRFEGPIVVALERHFCDRWVLDGGDELPPTKVLPAPAGRPARGQVIHEARVHCNEPNEVPNDVRELYLRHIRDARRSIFIENPYLYHPAIAEALSRAKDLRPELDVVLIVPCKRHNDNSFGQDAQEHHYLAWTQSGIEVYEYSHHFNHLKMAVFDERWSIHGSTNLNCRSLEDDKDFELVVHVDDEPFARKILAEVRDVDRTHARRVEPSDLHGTFAAFRKRVRDPRTLALLAKRVL